MSRCFPFPPPGYEKKPRNDDVDLLAKEKDKKKKHKREKRDREKRDGKERKHNDKNKSNHKEKKDQKEKHKEKRRHKGRDKEKISDRPTEERAQDQNKNKICDSSKDLGEVKDSKFMEEFAKRHKDDDATNRIFENGNSSVHTSERLGAQSSMEKERHNRMELIANNTSKESRNDGPCKYSDQKTMQGNKKAKEISPLAINITNRYGRSYDETGISMEKELDKRNAEHQALGRYDMDTGNGHKKQKRNNVLGQPMLKGAENTECKEVNDKQKVVQSSVKCQTNNERLHERLVDVAKEIEVSEKPKLREVDGGMPNHYKHKSREEKKHKRKDKERHKKEMEKDERRHKHEEHDKSSNIQEKHQLVTQCIATTKVNEKYAGVEEILKKRKDQPMNGFLHEIDQRPNKIPRPIENGRMIESCHLPTLSPSKLGGVKSNFEEHQALDKSKHVINGAVAVGLMHSVPADMSGNDGICLKAPHPDSKYLTTVYSVPKMEDWLEFDNQDWLFHRDVSRLIPKEAVKIKETTPQVWSEGRRIESADVFALPYVIPY